MSIKDTPYVSGAAKLGQRMATIRGKLDLPNLTKDVADLLLSRTLRRFDREEDPDGRHWVPHSKETVRKRGPGAKILNETGELRNSIRRIRGNAAGTVYTITGAGSRLGVEDPQIARRAAANQYGTLHIPQRRFLGIGRLDVKAVDSLMRRRAAKLQREI